MLIALDQLPDDTDALKALVAEQVARNEHLESKLLTLQEQQNYVLAKRYAASSEKLSPDQIWLFNEAETDAEVGPETDDEVLVPAYIRRKRGRRPLPATLPAQPIPKSLASPGLLAHVTVLEVPGCLAAVPTGGDPAAYRRGYSACHVGQLDDPGRGFGPTGDQSVAGSLARL